MHPTCFSLGVSDSGLDQIKEEHERAGSGNSFTTRIFIIKVKGIG